MTRPLAVVLAALGAGGCGSGGSVAVPPAGAGPAGSGAALNVLLISVDSLRGDLLDPGTGAPVAPRMSALRDEGCWFSAATAAAPWTTPSMMTVLTGLRPWAHHVRDHDMALSPKVPLLAQRLDEAGYVTAAFVPSATLSEDHGFSRGFDRFVNGHYGHIETTSPALAGQALSWLDSVAGGKAPFFCWVHLWDPHFEYLPPPPYDTAFPSSWQPPAGQPFFVGGLKNAPSTLRREQVAFLRSRYLGEVRFTDRYVGELLDFLERKGLAAHTLVVLVGDHGEAFQEHGWLTHTMRVYEEMVHVPLLLRWPGKLPAGRRIGEPVGLEDVTPTIADLAGLPPAPPPGTDGASLRPLWEAATGSVAPRAVATETVRQGAFAARREGSWKYILDFATCRGELFDLSSDPGETKDRAADQPARAAALRAALIHGYASDARAEAIPAVRLEDMQSERIKALRTLGYIQTDRFGDVVAETPVKDPRACR